MNPTLLILAAGLGSRYGGDTLKQMDKFGPNQERILEYSVYDAIRAGFKKVVFVIRKSFFSAFQEDIGSKLEKNIDVRYVFQEMDSFVPSNFDIGSRKKPRGTGHAVLVAKNEIDSPFVVVNADDYYGVDAYKKAFTQFEKITENACFMVGYILEKTLSPYGSVNRGVCSVSDEGNLLSVVEHLKISRTKSGVIQDIRGHEIDGNSIVSMNFWAFYPSIFDYIEKLFQEFLKTQGISKDNEFFIPSVVNNFIHEGGLCKVSVSNDSWCGVTNKQDKEYVQKTLASLVQKGVYPTPLF